MSRALALVDSSDESRKAERQNHPYALLETKLYVPRPRARLVSRPRLTNALRDGGTGRLTVVVAPAGFGKTTLLSSWLGDLGERSIGWVSLDATENDPTLFWSYFFRALQHVSPGVGTEVLAQLQAPRPPAIETLLAQLINELADIDRPFALVLDDYHVIESAEVHRGLASFVDHMPPRMRLVIASRAEPPLALARLRARGELTELRGTDLRFTADEATSFLNDVMALGLSRDDATTLEQRTEGWIAGLKLAALSLKARGDVRGFVDAFSGDNRHVADYLVEEVLQSEPEQVRRFLLGTAILGRMNASLCDAVMESADAQALLEDLERRSLFVMPLDDRREWYRYHHLFADVLQSQATTADAAAVRAAHDRASAWHEQNGVVADAVHHALAAENVERAADLLERTWPEKNRSYESAKWLARVKTLPDALVRSRPALSMGYAWGLLNSGELEAAEPRLCDVERWLDEHADARLSSELAAARVYLNQSLGDTPGTLEHAERNLALIPRDNHAARATGVALVALARWGRGELEAAHWTFSEALGEMRLAGQDLDVIRGMFVLGDLRAAQGRLRDAAEAYAQGLKAAGEAGPSAPVETDELHLGLAELHREWNDLPAAAAHLDAIVRAADYATYRGNRLRWCTAMAAVAEARGNLARAFVELEEAEHNERRDPIPRVRPIPALKARVRILQGRFEDAVDWARHANITAHDDLTYLHEFEHMVFARVLIARADKDVVPFLERLQVAAQRGGRAGSVIEILVLQALAQQALGSARPALDALAQAITLAEPEGFLRVFLDNGDRMRELLKTATARGLAGEYTRRVLAAFDAPEQPVIPVSTSPDGMMQALTTREHEILRLISGGLRNQEIAETLSISAATVKRHIANAYGKLGAGHRTEALKKAAELKLL